MREEGEKKENAAQRRISSRTRVCRERRGEKEKGRRLRGGEPGQAGERRRRPAAVALMLELARRKKRKKRRPLHAKRPGPWGGKKEARSNRARRPSFYLIPPIGRREGRKKGSMEDRKEWQPSSPEREGKKRAVFLLSRS